MKIHFNANRYFDQLLRICLIVVLTSSNAAGAATATTTTRIAMLPGHFGIGVKNAANELSWIVNTDTPYEYRYQYINPGWETWTTPTGQFASNYTIASQSNRYIPVFTWYELGGMGYGNSRSLWNYLSSSSSMNFYYNDFVLLLQKIAAVSTGAVIVQIEPDLWGFMQQGYGDDPTEVPVSVASSGVSRLSALANNAAGLAQAFLALRNAYAPNVILAWHASYWGPNNGYDPTLTEPQSFQTPQATGAEVAAFYMGLNAPFDMIFHDPSDADSAYKEIIRGQSSSTAWWTADAFASYQQYISVVYQSTGLYSMLWQVPIGNDLYRSENNTSYHYQDNRAQYFLQTGNIQNIQSYIGAGVIGLLFGNGQATDTDYMDYAGDGITNAPAIGGNTLVASYPDDDGGFLRLNTAAYYAAGPVQISGTSAAPVTVGFSSSPKSITAGQSATLTWSSDYATSCTGTGFSTSGAISGSTVVQPKVTSVYSVACSGPGGSATASSTVAVSRCNRGTCR